MKRKIKKAREFAMTACLVSMAATGCKSNVFLSEIVSDKQVISRGELLTRNLPANSDIYIVGEGNAESNFFKARAQVAPLKCGPVQFGLAAQHVDGSNFDAYQELGLLIRVAGKLPNGRFGKSDIGYFPEQNKLEGYAFVDSNKVLTDVLYKHDLDNGEGFVRPGFDFKLRKKASLGIEGKFAGKPRDLQTKYVGARVKINF